jgi:hypothetical protein
VVAPVASLDDVVLGVAAIVVDPVERHPEIAAAAVMAGALDQTLDERLVEIVGAIFLAVVSARVFVDELSGIDVCFTLSRTFSRRSLPRFPCFVFVYPTFRLPDKMTTRITLRGWIAFTVYCSLSEISERLNIVTLATFFGIHEDYLSSEDTNSGRRYESRTRPDLGLNQMPLPRGLSGDKEMVPHLRFELRNVAVFEAAADTN